MFRRATVSFSRIIAGAVGVQVGAAAVALSDKELSRKPEWYQNAVRSLESSLQKLSKYGYIESQETLNEAHGILEKFADNHNTEIQWRLARVLVEKAGLSKCKKEKKHLLHEAKEHAKRALAVEPSKGSAGAHKWYAIILMNLATLEKVDSMSEIVSHLEKAAAVDPKDPYTLHLLGVHQYHSKDYNAAISSFQKAENIRANFSSSNLYYLGATLKKTGKTDDAIKNLKQAVLNIPKCGDDRRAALKAKEELRNLGVNPKEYIVEDL